MENAREEVVVSGVVEHVIYRNEDNGYSIFRVDSDDSERLITVVGSVPYIGAGEGITVRGYWTHHVSYGEQIRATSVDRTLPKDEMAIIQYLSGGNVQGIGPVSAKRIVQKFGERTFDVLESSPQELAQVAGISRNKADKICENFKRQLSVRHLMERLMEYDIHPDVAMRLYKWYGDLAIDFVLQNPYMLTDEALGVEFVTADGMALNLDFGEDNPARADAGILYTLEHNLKNGHTYIPNEKLTDATARLLRVDESLCAEALERLCENGAVMRETINGRRACYLRRLYEEESESAARLRTMALNPPAIPHNLENMIDEIAVELGIEYAPMQLDAIRIAACSRIMLLTGGPGTGKSTSVRGMLSVFERLGLSAALCSPTGRAAKRLSELTGREALTVHRLLVVDFTYEGAGFKFIHGADDPIDADVVILDETSMVDISLFSSLLEALAPETRLILVGDKDQLPSVGPGNVLADLLTSGVIETVRLTEIFRQAHSSNIVLGAHAVNSGEMPPLKQKSGDLFFIAKRDPSAVSETVVDLCTRRLPAGMGFEPSQIQVLSPTRRGTAGTYSLNNMLQEALNPPSADKSERRSGEFIFRQSDRVMHIRNNYDLQWQSMFSGESGMGIFNGDIGIIEDIDDRSQQVLVRYDDRLVYYPFELLNELEPAYAMTVHKSQGSEYPVVVLVASDAAPQLLTRQIFYTAMTRAQQLLVIVGSEEIIARMVATNRRAGRYSGLKYRITDD